LKSLFPQSSCAEKKEVKDFPDSVTLKSVCDLKWRESFVRLLLSIYRLAGWKKASEFEEGEFCGEFSFVKREIKHRNRLRESKKRFYEDKRWIKGWKVYLKLQAD
jgi:hypothetical protein